MSEMRCRNNLWICMMCVKWTWAAQYCWTAKRKHRSKLQEKSLTDCSRTSIFCSSTNSHLKTNLLTWKWWKTSTWMICWVKHLCECFTLMLTEWKSMLSWKRVKSGQELLGNKLYSLWTYSLQRWQSGSNWKYSYTKQDKVLIWKRSSDPVWIPYLSSV